MCRTATIRRWLTEKRAELRIRLTDTDVPVLRELFGNTIDRTEPGAVHAR